MGRLLSLFTAGALLAGLIDPRDLWLPAIFTPILPWLLLSVTLLMVFWGYRKQYREALVPLVVLLLAIPALRKTIAWKGPSNEALTTNGTELTLATANVVNLKAPRQKNYPLDSIGVKELVARLDADIIFLQEFYFKPGQWRFDLIAAEGPYAYWVKAGEGSLAIFSRYPLKKVEEVFFDNEVNGYLMTNVHLPDDTIRLINAHLQSNRVTGMANNLEKERNLTKKDNWVTLKQMFGRYGRATASRTKQAEVLLSLVEKSPHPVVLAGDMNDVPTSFPYRVLNQSEQLMDAWIEAGSGVGTTYAGALPGLRIDYVFLDSALTVSEAKVLPEGASDHRPVRVRFMLPLVE